MEKRYNIQALNIEKLTCLCEYQQSILQKISEDKIRVT